MVFKYDSVSALFLIFPARISDIAIFQLTLQELVHGERHRLARSAIVFLVSQIRLPKAPPSQKPGKTERTYATRITLGVMPL